MGNRSTTAQVREKDRHVTVSQHETDSPVLPMAQLAQLKEVHPERVDWVFLETTKEAEFRRTEIKRVNGFAFAERIVGMIFGLGIGCVGLFLAYDLGMHGHEVSASVIGGATLVGIVSSFLVASRRGK